ncbi:MFS transporter, partial [Klebsiella pneumoniae]|uniref:MFS transporter n=1 Tax=Klebsiella pneumoniae TaxID=573 RepID=UPI0014384B92
DFAPSRAGEHARTSIGFQGAYLVLGLVALGFTLISVFTLSGPGPLSLLRRQVNEVA